MTDVLFEVPGTAAKPAKQARRGVQVLALPALLHGSSPARGYNDKLGQRAHAIACGRPEAAPSGCTYTIIAAESVILPAKTGSSGMVRLATEEEQDGVRGSRASWTHADINGRPPYRPSVLLDRTRLEMLGVPATDDAYST